MSRSVMSVNGQFNPLRLQAELKEYENEVMEHLQNPFGTYPLAKYLLFGNNTNPIYNFSTTSRSEAECIDIMKDKINDLDTDYLYFYVYKQHPSKERVIVYQHKKLI